MSAMIGRRDFLGKAGVFSAALVVPGVVLAQEKKGKQEEAEVSPTEDLMREHGVLNRILLIYDECNRRLASKADFDPSILGSAADLIKQFIEDYHEKLEENHLFPRFEKAHKLTDLVTTLRTQHAAGRVVTGRIRQIASTGLKKDQDRQSMQQQLQAFNRMYRPHEAREDTVLFPALHEIVSAHEFDALGEQFEGLEHKIFGGDGFEIARDKVAKLEQSLGIYELAQFTPK